MTTITSNEEHVRMQIFDGVLPAEEGVMEMLRLERAQFAAFRARAKRMHAPRSIGDRLWLLRLAFSRAPA